MNILICYISLPSSFTEDKLFYAGEFPKPFMGRQTNEAPTFYAIELLKAQGKTLDKIIAMRTTESAWKDYEESVRNYLKAAGTASLSENFFDIIETEPGNPFSDALTKVIGKVSLSDNIIIDTSGGPRSAVTMLTLLSRFLQERGCNILFSINAEIPKNNDSGTLTITQDNDLLDLLEATRVFTSTGNIKELRKVCLHLNIPHKISFFSAANRFYNTILVCNTGILESRINDLSAAINTINKTTYSATKPNEVIFKHVLVAAIEQKMSFINAQCPLLEVVQWCNDNWYLQQAITILKENIIGRQIKLNGKCVSLKKTDRNILRCLRNNINHASVNITYNKSNLSEEERIKIITEVKRMLEEPGKMKTYIDTLLQKIRQMCNIEPLKKRKDL